MPNDTTVVWQFFNLSEDYHETYADDKQTFFITIATTSGRIIGQAELPGPVLAKDADGLLYIRHSNVPDERVIGVYEVVDGG